MGKRKNRHCQSKREVILKELHKRKQEEGKTETAGKSMLRTINNVKPAMEQARRSMRERNRRESRKDVREDYRSD